MRDPVVVFVIPVLERFEKACSGEHVDAASAPIVEDVVRRTRSLTARDFFSRLCVKHKHS